MTRRDWWLGIIVIVAALAVHALVTLAAAASVKSKLDAMFTPGLRPVASARITRPTTPEPLVDLDPTEPRPLVLDAADPRLANVSK